MAAPSVRPGPVRALGAMRLLDEAFHLIRLHPGALATYALGAMPFWLVLLYFWNDMSRSAFAARRCVTEAFLLALLFIVMKTCQSRFMTALSGIVSAGSGSCWGLRRWLSVAVTQSIIQSTAFVVLPVAAGMLFPFPWCLAFYQNALLFGSSERASIPELLTLSWRQARLWPRQNNAGVYVLSAFGAVVFLQLVIAMVFLPQLLRMFTGIETVFTRSGWRMLNTTLFASAAALTYLVVDPLVKSFYVLRCFYGESIESGEDLRIEWRRLTAGRQRRRTLMVSLALLASVSAGRSAAEEPGGVIPAPVLREAVEETIDDPRYAWRMPRERPPEEETEQGPITRFFAGVKKLIASVLDTCWEWVRRVARWLRKAFERDDASGRPRKAGEWRWLPRALLVGGLVVVLLVSGWAVVRLWRERQRREEETVDAEAVPVPDLTDEGITAADMPTDDWLKLARELMAEGKLRLGLRAAYLSALSLLADHEVLTIARHKSNLDYRRELSRRAHQLPDVVACFNASVLTFDRVWYGTHGVSHETLDAFLSTLDRMRSDLES